MSISSTDNDSGIGVVMVVQSLPPMPSGGAEIQALRLAEQLIQQGVSLFFITPGSGKHKGFTELNGVPVYRLYSPLNWILDLLFFIQRNSPQGSTVIEYDDTKTINNTISRKIGPGARLRYLIFLANAYFFLRKRKNKFTIIHSHTIEWPAYVSAKLSKWFNKKLIIKDSTMNGLFNILRFPSGKKKQKLIISRATFVAMTNIIRDNLIQCGVMPANITMIPNGININGNAKTDYSGSKIVLFVGNLYQQPAKGVDILLKAWQKVLASVPSAILKLAGDGDLPAYKEYVKSLGISESVHFLGKQNDIPSLMLGCDIFVLPSRREGMPNVLMEAMLRGLPCIATNISGSQDLIVSGESGMLVPPANVAELASAIVYLLSNRQAAARMGINARSRIITHYPIENIAGRYLTLYRK